MLLTRTVLAFALLLALALPAAGAEEDAPTPLLEAMAYLDPRSEPVSVSFVDWLQLKQFHDGEGITSASPLADRQRLLLDIVRAESVPISLGLARLATWPEAWGWDSTDLDWQAHYRDGRDVLRFGEHWNVAPFRAALESRGYERDAGGGIEIWLPPNSKMPTDLRLEQVGMEIDGAEQSTSYAGVAISPDGRTVVILGFARGVPPKQLRRASRPDLGRIAGTPAVRAATALERPLTAAVAAGREMICAWPGEDDPFSSDPEISAMVERLRHYEARASGYTRRAPDVPVDARFVFGYGQPRQARADLAGRGALFEADIYWSPSTPAWSLTDARTEGRQLILDAKSTYSHPGPWAIGAGVTWEPFAMCGRS